MSHTQMIKDLALSAVLSDLFTHGRVIDMDLQNGAGLESRTAAYHALKAHPTDVAVLSAIDPDMAGGMKWGEDYAGMSQNLRVGVAQRLCKALESEVQSKYVLSQESLSNITHSFAGRLALKVGIIAGTAVTIGVYKRQLIELLSDGIAELSLIAAQIKETKIHIGKKVRATPKQVNKQLAIIKGIVAETDKLQKTVTDIGADKLSVDAARAQVNQSITRMMSYGVPIDKTGAAAPMSKEMASPYTTEDAEKAEWDSAALNAVSGSLNQISQQVKLDNLSAHAHGAPDPSIGDDMKTIAYHAQRASVRGAHYVLYLIRGLLRVIHNLKFVYVVK